MNKLEKLAIRIGEISDEIRDHKNQREINLENCAGSGDEDFESDRGFIDEASGQKESCLFTAYTWVKECRSMGEPATFDETIRSYGCLNCIGAHNAKMEIGLLKQERGRIVGNISKIGKSL